ncbi:MAG: NAD(P)-dependent oxidoreductase [Balneola sp.]|jgi:NAD(P)H dehydrogenase (quinone)|nr:NAD(P)-dependent oxidoreductase [Balneola sp.]MBE78976.1 NAD(P)-dependent oxidoreductase [Balneola sp.]HBX65257.1 NAD(P)-dependent oxidoreductase [Balneolaceae bacterium]|tara:strand:+ start:31 stop:903 length:873 start_codon:yes stop_codon:yes gene_type:complete
MSTILVTGSTGSLGTATIEFLLEKGSEHTIIGLARDEDKAASLKQKGAEIRMGNYDDPESLEKAFQGVDKLFFISASEIGSRVEQHKNVVEAAKKADVDHVVYTSFQRKTNDESSPIWMVAESHLHTEKWLEESELDYTFLKNNLYMDFVPMFIGENVVEQGTVYIPAGEGKMACVLRDEMAEASANVLLGEGHKNTSYTFSNSENYGFDEVASILSEISGKDIGYVSPEVDEYTKTMKDAGVPEEAIGMTVGFAQAIEQGEINETSSDLEELLGRKPVSLEDFLKQAYS